MDATAGFATPGSRFGDFAVESPIHESERSLVLRCARVGAAGTAFLIGAGVASGDIVVTTARRMRSRVSPAIDTVTSGIEVSVIAPVDRYVRERAGSVFTSRDGREPRDKADG